MQGLVVDVRANVYRIWMIAILGGICCVVSVLWMAEVSTE
jgi:hypothetical protein